MTGEGTGITVYACRNGICGASVVWSSCDCLKERLGPERVVYERRVPVPVVPAVLTDELVETVAEAILREQPGRPWRETSEGTRNAYRRYARAALRAAGFQEVPE